jgi:hypothetical protein
MHRIQDLLARHEPTNDRFYTVAIDGRGGSGKSTLTNQLRDQMIGFTVMNGDDYFEPVVDDLVWGAFNDDRFIQDIINPLKAGNTLNAWTTVWEPLWDAHIVSHDPAAHADIVLDGTKPFEEQIRY